MSKDDYSYSQISCSKQRTCLEKILMFTLTICVVSIVVLVLLLTKPRISPNNQEICLTKECAEIAARVTSSIDYSIDPCDNFYDFACGMWIKKHVVPDDRPNLYTHGVVHEEVMVTVKFCNILEFGPSCGMWIKKHVVPDDRPNLYTHGVVHEEVMVTVKSCGMWIKKHVVPDDRPNLYTHGVVHEEVMVTVKSCGMWIKKHVVPDDRPNLYTHGVVHEEVMVTVKYLLEGTAEDDVASIRKARDFYESCMNQTQIELVNISAMISLLDELGRMPMLGNSSGGRWNESSFNLMADLIKTQRFMNAPLMHLYVGPDDKDSGSRIIQVDEPSFGMRVSGDIHSGPVYNALSDGFVFYGMNLASFLGTDPLKVARHEPPFGMRVSGDIHSGPVYNALRDGFVFYGVNVASFLGADPEVARQDLYEIYDLHGVINNISKTNIEKRNRFSRYNKMTIAQLATNFGHADNSSNSTQLKFNWLTFIQSIIDIADENITLDDTENIILNSPNYYYNIFKTLSQQKPRTIKNYIVWLTIAPMFNKLPARFVDEFTVYNNFLTGTNSKLPRWKKCSLEVMSAFSMAVGRLFVNERFDEEAKEEALEMIHEIREAFYERLDELDWMDPHTRNVAKDKAKHIVEKIGYPDYILDDGELNKIYEMFHVDRKEYFTNTLNIIRQVRKMSLQHLRDRYQLSNTRADVPPANVNAYYTPHFNLISFPAGILQPPYYSKYQPRSMNFGSIGWLIGHEFIHGFDDTGRRFDKNGNMVQWWSNEAIKKFTNKTQCIINQYNSYQVKKVGLNIDGILTLGENIADNGGLVLSYRAYENWLKHHKVTESGLPGLNYTHRQLFFINFAQGWCGVATEQYAMKQLYIDTHSPVRYRIIGSLQNSEDFSRVFQCPVGSYMNPSKKCHVW